MDKGLKGGSNHGYNEDQDEGGVTLHISKGVTMKKEWQVLQKIELLRAKNHLDKPSPIRQVGVEASKPQHARVRDLGFPATFIF